MTVSIVSGVAALALAALLWRHRAHYIAERPFEHDRTEYTGGRQLAEALARSAGLTAVEGAVGWAWLADFLLWPVLLLWGDLRLSRPETQLARWRLVGKWGDRDAVVELGPDRVTARLAADGPLVWALSSTPLEQQEHLRALHPIGGETWTRVVPTIDALFQLGAVEVKTEPGVALAIVPREKVTLERLPQLLDALSELAQSPTRQA